MQETQVPHAETADLKKALIKEIDPLKDPVYGAMRSKASSARSSDSEGSETMKKLRAPGGLRRDYLNSAAEEAGVPEEKRPKAWKRTFLESVRPLIATGYYDNKLGISLDPDTGAEIDVADGEGEADSVATVLAIFKSFVGTGITFLPGAYAYGGFLFCSLGVVMIAIFNGVCSALLLECREKTEGNNYGAIAVKAIGGYGKQLVQGQLVISQFGACIAYMIFVAQLAHSVGVESKVITILLELIVLIPLCLIRNVDHLELPNLLADVILALGLGAIIYKMTQVIVEDGTHDSIEPFKGSSCGLFIGTAIFSFEGTPMVLPIRSAMKEPQKYWSLFLWTYAGIVALFLAFAALGYLAYGEGAETIVLLDMPNGAFFGLVKWGYMIALMLGVPLMFIPAARITELWLFGVTNKSKIVEKVNTMRIVEVSIFAIITATWYDSFDKFLNICGACCDSPIMILYPALFHYMLCADTFWKKTLDLCLIVVGLVAVAIAMWANLTE
eukprot:gnl/TRDRNA2_/TRDRNA2_81475_c0_seq1.p1 gnl/TRDRNA2_/TRDRNA2_81475_c0~~gnl/TRDRNA2_/TRDRNA2_81475_c0_seq1.p1  ORF type:complete len:500 (+),score=98.76 gnl/TRDRNA2_/TRDRNA2_81475_c0_seq1:120-1619(+)